MNKKKIWLKKLESKLIKIFNNVISNKLNDKRLQGICITSINLTADLSYAKVFFTCFSDKTPLKVIIPLLDKASGNIKNEIAKMRIMRRIPQFNFIFDDTEVKALEIENIISKTKSDDDL